MQSRLKHVPCLVYNNEEGIQDLWILRGIGVKVITTVFERFRPM